MKMTKGPKEKMEPKREEKKESKMKPKARATVEKKEMMGFKKGGKVKGC